MLNDYIHTVKDYFNFSLSREFCYNTKHQPTFNYKRNNFELAGDYLTSPLFSPSDFLLKNIYEPLMVVALTVSCIAGATLFFYPEKTAKVAKKYTPLLQSIEPWMVKFAVFAVTESFILGLGLRTFGRYSNNQLYGAWLNREISPIHLGSNIGWFTVVQPRGFD